MSHHQGTAPQLLIESAALVQCTVLVSARSAHQEQRAGREVHTSRSQPTFVRSIRLLFGPRRTICTMANNHVVPGDRCGPPVRSTGKSSLTHTRPLRRSDSRTRADRAIAQRAPRLVQSGQPSSDLRELSRLSPRPRRGHRDARVEPIPLLVHGRPLPPRCLRVAGRRHLSRVRAPHPLADPSHGERPRAPRIGHHAKG